MSTITVPPELQALLGHLTERTEIRGSHGEPLGVFVPRGVAEAERLELWKGLFDLEEAERSLAAERDKGRPLREILRDLKAGQPASPAVSREEDELYVRAAAMVDPEEMERIAAAEHGKGRPLAELLRRLEAGEGRAGCGPDPRENGATEPPTREPAKDVDHH